MSDDTLLYGNESMMLFFDDDGEDLFVGDRVLINDTVEAMIGEIDGLRQLVGFPRNEIVYTLERIAEPDPILAEWPETLNS